MEMPDGAETRLREYLDTIGEVLGHKKRRESFATYAMGLLGEGDRKSVEPLAARATGSPTGVNAAHQRLLHFVADSKWSDEAVREVAAKHAVAAMEQRSPVASWILDDTGFLKQGKHSVGVQRQYTGSAGKITNCQIGVSLCVATQQAQVPVDFELYLPESWTKDKARREETRIPSEIEFKTKPELAMEMVKRAMAAGLPTGVMLADAAYGSSSTFRKGLRELGLEYAVGVNSTTHVWRVDKLGVRYGRPLSAMELAKELGRKAFRRTAWREGTRGQLFSNFAMRRVLVAHDDGTLPKNREDVWLLMEWPDGEKEPTRFTLATLPRNIARKKLVCIVKERYRTEKAYEELKGELGLDHFEGRSFPGWHHHVSVALSCYAFIVAERARSFFSATQRQREARQKRLTA